MFIDYCKNIHVWTKQIFNDAQYSYIKYDLASIQRPSIFARPLWSEKNSYTFGQTGRIQIELHFNFEKMREEVAQNVIQIANDILLINLNQEFTRYMQLNMPGLFWFGKYAKADYTNVYQQESIVYIEFDYSVDLLAYKKGLLALGCDITSPDEPIYLPAEFLKAEIAVLNKDETVAFVTT